MICPDVNVLVYAYHAAAPMHTRAAAWWEEQLNGQGHVGVAWPVFQGALRLLTGRQVIQRPYTAQEFFTIADEWWARPNVTLWTASSETYRHFRALMESYQLVGGASTDALIAAFALEHGAHLATNDTDFARFRELRIQNPFS